MASAPTLEEFIEAKKTVLEFLIRRKYGGADPRETEGLFSNKQAAEELLIGESTWYRARNELGIKAKETRNSRPLFTREQIEQVRRHLDGSGKPKTQGKR